MSECDNIREWLLAEEDELAPEERRRTAAHLAACPECERESRLLREVITRTRALQVPEPPSDFWVDFNESVRRRLEAVPPPSPGLLTSVRVRLRHFWESWRVPAIAAATALGLVLAFGAVRSDRAPRQVPPADALALVEEIGIGQNLDVLENFDVLERLDLLRRLDVDRGGRLS